MKICTNQQCKKVGLAQPQEAFAKQAGSLDGRACKCKLCLNAAAKKLLKQQKLRAKSAPFFARKDTIELAIEHEKNKLLNKDFELLKIKQSRRSNNARVLYADTFVAECKSALYTMESLLS